MGIRRLKKGRIAISESEKARMRRARAFGKNSPSRDYSSKQRQG